jgi:hypothetical protein
MTRDDLWTLFKKTGDISYYIKYKDMLDKGLDRIGDNKSYRNYN